MQTLLSFRLKRFRGPLFPVLVGSVDIRINDLLDRCGNTNRELATILLTY